MRHGSRCHHAAAATAGSGAKIQHMIGAADGLFVVFHHHQRIAALAQVPQCIEQQAVVARVQADGGLIEHVTDTAQVRAQLRGQAQSLRLAAGKRRRGAIQRQIGQANAFEELQAAADFLQQVSGNGLLARTALQFAKEGGKIGHRKSGQICNGLAAKLHCQCQRIQAPAIAAAAAVILLCMFEPGGFLAGLFGVELRQGEPGAEAALAPALGTVVGEQARIKFGKTPAATRGRRAATRTTAWRRHACPTAASVRPCPHRAPCRSARAALLRSAPRS